MAYLGTRKRYIEEQIFLLSYAEATDADRVLLASDYALAQGLRSGGGIRWWLRSPNHTYEFYACYINGKGYAVYNNYVYWDHIGIAPSLTLQVFPEGQDEDVLIAYFSRMGEGRYEDKYKEKSSLMIILIFQYLFCLLLI